MRFLTASREGLCELLGLLCHLIWILGDTLLLNALALTFLWKVGRVSCDPGMANRGAEKDAELLQLPGEGALGLISDVCSRQHLGKKCATNPPSSPDGCSLTFLIFPDSLSYLDYNCHYG